MTLVSAGRIGTHTCLGHLADDNEAAFGFHTALSHIDYSYWPRWELATFVDEIDNLYHCSEKNSASLVCLIITLC